MARMRRGSRGSPVASTITDHFEVLLAALSPSQQNQLAISGNTYFDVTGSLSGQYRLYLHGDIIQFFPDQAPRPWCAHLPYGNHTHPALNLLAVKLLLEANEGKFLRRMQPLRGFPPLPPVPRVEPPPPRARFYDRRY